VRLYAEPEAALGSASAAVRVGRASAAAANLPGVAPPRAASSSALR
jgi:hypothetical protein